MGNVKDRRGAKPGEVGQREHDYTAHKADQVERMAAAGLTRNQIAILMDLSISTLNKYYQDDMATGRAKAINNVATTLYQKAIGGNVTAMIFFLKTQAGWSETMIHELGGVGNMGATSRPDANLKVEFVPAGKPDVIATEGVELRKLPAPAK